MVFEGKISSKIAGFLRKNGCFFSGKQAFLKNGHFDQKLVGQ